MVASDVIRRLYFGRDEAELAFATGGPVAVRVFEDRRLRVGAERTKNG
jgi:hypothetical protein